MMRSLFGFTFAMMLAVPAWAGEMNLTYQAVMQVRSSHAMSVLDEAAHRLGIGAFKGLAIFPGGEVAAHRYEGWFDLKDGSGRFLGYARWQFDDGSTIWAKYDGTVRMMTSTNFRIEARLYDISGAGRFAGASGEGGFQGRRVESIESGGSTYLTGQLRLDLPG